jgi:hypothetical protein
MRLTADGTIASYRVFPPIPHFEDSQPFRYARQALLAGHVQTGRTKSCVRPSVNGSLYLRKTLT